MKLKILTLLILNSVIIFGQTEEIIEIEQESKIEEERTTDQQQNEDLYNFLKNAKKPMVFFAKNKEEESYQEALYFTKFNTILEDFFNKIVTINPILSTITESNNCIIDYTVQPSSDFFITQITYRIMGTLPDEVNAGYVMSKERVGIVDLIGSRQFKPLKHSFFLDEFDDYLEQRKIAKNPKNWKELDMKLVIISLTFSIEPQGEKVKLIRFKDSKAIKRLNTLLTANSKLKDLQLSDDKVEHLERLKNIKIPSKKVWSHKNFDCKNNELEELFLYRIWDHEYASGTMYTLPDCICEFENLKKIKFSNHEIDKIPTCLASLNNLKEIIVPKNKLFNLPKNIGDFKQLKTLVVSDNYIQEIPKSISKLSQIEFIDLSNNYLVTIPKEIIQLKSLIKLDLSGNNISKKQIKWMRKKMGNCDIID